MFLAITTFGAPTLGRIRSYYHSLTAAVKDAREVGGGSCTTVRVLECPSVSAAKSADISDKFPVVWES